ncbi:MAG: hypothetical protein IKD04_09080 [Clostridia bacterium]|nr:hypothetical protein [Clostridia bacterium]
MKAKYKLLISFSLIFAVMFLLPLTVLILESDSRNDAGWLFMSFLQINPVLAVALGVLAGTDIKRLWFVPLVAVVIFLPFSLILIKELDGGIFNETAKLKSWLWIKEIGIEIFIYALIYLWLGLLSGAVTVFVKKMKKL